LSYDREYAAIVDLHKTWTHICSKSSKRCL